MSKPRVVTSFSLDPDLYYQLKQTLERERKSLSDFVREQAEEYVKRHAAGNPAVPLQKWFDDPTYVACPTILEAAGFNWASFSQQDLGKIQLIMARELERVRNTRRQRQHG